MPRTDEPSCYATVSTDSVLERLLRQYERTGTAITVNFRDMVSCLSTPDRVTHLVHTYPAKLLMHIPFFFLANSIMSRPGSRVLDPFCGSGTVLLESLLSGRTAHGFDTNPLACLISKVKTTPIEPSRLATACNALLNRIPQSPREELPDVVNLRHWFYPHVTRQLLCLREAIARTRDPVIRDFFRISFSQCARKVSLADPRLAVPVRLKEGQYPLGHPFREGSDARLLWLRHANVHKVFAGILRTNSDRLARLPVGNNRQQTVTVHCGDARQLRAAPANAHSRDSRLAAKSVDFVITSPPYPGAQKYIRSASLSLGWLGLCPSDSLIDLKRATIGREEFTCAECSSPCETGVKSADRLLKAIWEVSPIRATIAGTYLTEMHQVLLQCYRVLKPRGHLVLVVANNRIAGHDFRTQNYLRHFAEDLGFVTLLRLTDDIRSRGLMTKRNRTASVISRESVLVFRKME
jgi:DNA modification methylase